MNGCYSNYPVTSYTATEYCARKYDLDYVTRPVINVTFTYNGEVLTGNEWSSTPSPTTPLFSVETRSLDEWNGEPWTHHLTGSTSVEMVTLIHRGAEDGSPSSGGASDATETAPAESPASTGDDESRAITGSQMSFVLLAVLGISAVVGGLH